MYNVHRSSYIHIIWRATSGQGDCCLLHIHLMSLLLFLFSFFSFTFSILFLFSINRTVPGFAYYIQLGSIQFKIFFFFFLYIYFISMRFIRLLESLCYSIKCIIICIYLSVLWLNDVITTTITTTATTTKNH